MSLIRFRCVDAIALSLVFGSAGTLVAAAVVSKQETDNRIKCASNLRQIGQAIMLYANENRGAYPRTRHQTDAAPTWGTPYSADKKDVGPTKDADAFTSDPKGDYAPSPAALATRPEKNDVTAALFLLLRTEDLVPQNFICPSTTLKPFDYGGGRHTALEWTNFPGKAGLAKHLSYSYQNPYPSKQAISSGFKLNNSVTAEFAIMADMNPGTAALKELRPSIADVDRKNKETLEAMRPANSLNHGGDGQNVLYGDGHVEFAPTPFVGVHHDNIYTANGRELNERQDAKADFAISPADANDSILLPTASDIGQKPESSIAPPTPLTKPEDAKAILGTYAATVEGRRFKLTIDEKTLTATSGPMTLKFEYRVLGLRGDGLVLELTAPETPAAQTVVTATADSVDFDGAVVPGAHWQRTAAK